MANFQAYTSPITDFVNGATPRTITLTTVPTGYVFVLDSVDFVTLSVTNAGNDPVFTLGNASSSTAYEQTHNQDTLGGLMLNPPDMQTAPAGTAIIATITTNSTATTQTGIIAIKGYLVYANSTTPTPPTPPAVNSFVGYMYTVDSGGNAVGGITVNYSLARSPHGYGLAYDGSAQVATSDDNGLLELSMVPGGRYKFWSGLGQPIEVQIPPDASSPYALPDFSYGC